MSKSSKANKYPSEVPSQFEMQILSVLWRSQPCSARDVLENLPDGKERAYTSVLSVLQVMVKKGYVSRERDGNRHLYSATLKEAQVARPLLKNLLKNVFGGNPAAVMQHLLHAEDVNADELAEIRNLIDNHPSNKPSK